MFRRIGTRIDEMIYNFTQWYRSKCLYSIYVYLRSKLFIKQDKFKEDDGHFERFMTHAGYHHFTESQTEKLVRAYYKGDELKARELTMELNKLWDKADKKYRDKEGQHDR